MFHWKVILNEQVYLRHAFKVKMDQGQTKEQSLDMTMCINNAI